MHCWNVFVDRDSKGSLQGIGMLGAGVGYPVFVQLASTHSAVAVKLFFSVEQLRHLDTCT